MVHQPQTEGRAIHEKYLLENIEQLDILNIRKTDLSIISDEQLFILYEVCRDRKNYRLANSNLTFDPSQWNDESRKDWIEFVSRKYVDNNVVDLSRGDSPDFHKELRAYWQFQQHLWEEAARICDQMVTISQHRDFYEKIIELTNTLSLSSPHPRCWTSEDVVKFKNWYATDYEENSSTTREAFFKSKMEKWALTLNIVKHYYGTVPVSPESMDESEDMSPSSAGVTDYTPSPPSCQMFSEVPSFYHTPPTMNVMTDYGDPEDWDKEMLNRWLQMEFLQFGADFSSLKLPERRRRLVMIYVRCAWPNDEDKNALTGLCRVFENDIGSVLYNDILRMRPNSRAQESVTKPDSQRHRNRRDLHLWEFLLILLANSELEYESIHWKDKSRGVFELANRNRVAKMWGLTKGNNKMSYDNMSRSVRQYYKEDKTGIMIRHQTGTASLGKYSYQFSMSNNEVSKLWKSLYPSS